MAHSELLQPVSNGVHSYLLDNELLLFSEHAGAIFRLNSSAALIWFCCEEGLNRASITAELAQTFRLSDLQAATVVSTTLSEWEALGLLGQDQETLPSHPDNHVDRYNSADITKPTASVHEYPHELRYRLLDTVFRIRLPKPGMEHIAESVFAHLGVTGNEPYDVSLDVHQTADGYSLHCSGKLVAQGFTEQELAPLLHAHAAAEAHSRAEYLIAIHAAAVSNGKACIVLPAMAGNGKSTLMGALIGSGLHYCTDELVLLKGRTHTIQAVPVGIALKPGSWPVLNTYYPGLGDLPVFLRPDGKQVRYLLPAKQTLPDNMARCYPVHSLVFPRYHPEHGTALNRISPADALCRLAEAGYDMQGGLDGGKVTELVEWIGGLDCYELQINDLQEAVSRIAGLLP
jgi:hypothetical protein